MAIPEGLRTLVAGRPPLSHIRTFLATKRALDVQGTRDINAFVGATRGVHERNSRISLWERHLERRSHGFRKD